MINFASLLVPDKDQDARPIHLVDKSNFPAWLKKRPAEDRYLLQHQAFDAKAPFAYALLPRGGEFEVVASVKSTSQLSPWCLAKLSESLPEGTYRLVQGEPGEAALGWLLAQNRFDDYRSKDKEPARGPRVLVTSEAARIEGFVRLAEASALVRDLVNMPALDLGPARLEQIVRDEATRLGAQVQVASGAQLKNGFPLIAAVGGAAVDERAPRLIELQWGKPEDPRVAVIGKASALTAAALI